MAAALVAIGLMFFGKFLFGNWSNMISRRKKSTKIILALIILFILTLIIAGIYKNKYKIVPIIENESYKQLQMFDDKTGWALTSDNRILYTTNGYEEFYTTRKIEKIDAVSDNYVYADFMDENTAYVVYFSEIGTKIVVEYTLNAGKSWHYTSIPHDGLGKAHSLYIDFGDKDNGYVLCCSKAEKGKWNKTLFRTKNQGVSFYNAGNLTDSINGEPTGLCFVNSDKGYIATKNSESDNYLYQTNDGGTIWRTQVLIESDEVYTKTDIYTPVFCGDKKNTGKIILKQSGTYSSQFTLMSTRSGGLAWIKEMILEFDDIKSFSFVNDKQGFVINQDGKVFELRKNSLSDLFKKE